MSRAKNLDEIDALRLSRTSMEILIYESNLGEKDTMVARLRYIGKKPMIEIAGELSDLTRCEVSRNTVARRLQEIKKNLLEHYRILKI